MPIIEIKDRTVAYSQHQKLFECCEKLFELSQKTIDSIDQEWRDSKRWNNYERFLALLLARNSKAFMGCTVLCNKGQQSNADSLLRVLVESFIVMKFVQTDKDSLADKFLHYGPVSIKRLFDTYNRTNNPFLEPLLKDFEKLVPDWKSAYEKVKGKYPKEAYWSGKTLREMAEAAGFIDDSKEIKVVDIYDSLYKLLSETFHSSPQSFLEGMKKISDGWAIDPNEPIEKLDSTLVYAFTFFYDILVEINNEFNVQMDKEFEQIWKEFEVVRDSQIK